MVNTSQWQISAHCQTVRKRVEPLQTMSNYAHELAQPNISNFTKAYDGGSGRWDSQCSEKGGGKLKYNKLKNNKKTWGAKSCDFLTMGGYPAGTVFGMLGSIVNGDQAGWGWHRS